LRAAGLVPSPYASPLPTSAPGLGSPPPTSAPGLGSPLPHLRRGLGSRCALSLQLLDARRQLEEHAHTSKLSDSDTQAALAKADAPHARRGAVLGSASTPPDGVGGGRSRGRGCGRGNGNVQGALEGYSRGTHWAFGVCCFASRRGRPSAPSTTSAPSATRSRTRSSSPRWVSTRGVLTGYRRAVYVSLSTCGFVCDTSRMRAHDLLRVSTRTGTVEVDPRRHRQ
jgi:hypothetical protein